MLRVLLMIWNVTADHRLSMSVISHRLRVEAPDLDSALETGRQQLTTGLSDLPLILTGVVLTPCEAPLVWADQPCPNVATKIDGYCDECRDELEGI